MSNNPFAVEKCGIILLKNIDVFCPALDSQHGVERGTFGCRLKWLLTGLTMFGQWRVVYWTGLDEWDSPPGSLPTAPGPRTSQATQDLPAIHHVCYQSSPLQTDRFPQRNCYWRTMSAHFLGSRSHPEMWWVQILVPCGVPTSQPAVSFQFRLRPDKRYKKV